MHLETCINCNYEYRIQTYTRKAEPDARRVKGNAQVEGDGEEEGGGAQPPHQSGAVPSFKVLVHACQVHLNSNNENIISRERCRALSHICNNYNMYMTINKGLMVSRELYQA